MHACVFGTKIEVISMIMYIYIQIYMYIRVYMYVCVRTE